MISTMVPVTLSLDHLYLVLWISTQQRKHLDHVSHNSDEINLVPCFISNIFSKDHLKNCSAPNWRTDDFNSAVTRLTRAGRVICVLTYPGNMTIIVGTITQTNHLAMTSAVVYMLNQRGLGFPCVGSLPLIANIRYFIVQVILIGGWFRFTAPSQCDEGTSLTLSQIDEVQHLSCKLHNFYFAVAKLLNI